MATDGLIVKENNLGENDRVVVALTRERGLVNAFVTGARRPKNRNSTSTALLAYSNLILFKNKETYNINEASPIEVFFPLRSDIERLTIAQYICELCLELAPYEENAEEYLRLALNSLHFLCRDDCDTSKIKAVTELRMISIAGYMPDLSGCASCGGAEEYPMYFDTVSGNVYCNACCQKKGLPMLDKTLYAAMRHIIGVPFEKLYSFTIPHKSAEELSKITEKFIVSQTQRKFRTLDFLHSLGDIH